MRAALVIAGRILRQRLRDRSAIVFAVLTPLGLALAFSVLIPNKFSSFHTNFIVIDADGGHVAGILTNDVLGEVVAGRRRRRHARNDGSGRLGRDQGRQSQRGDHHPGRVQRCRGGRAARPDPDPGRRVRRLARGRAVDRGSLRGRHGDDEPHAHDDRGHGRNRGRDGARERPGGRGRPWPHLRR